MTLEEFTQLLDDLIDVVQQWGADSMIGAASDRDEVEVQKLRQRVIDAATQLQPEMSI